MLGQTGRIPNCRPVTSLQAGRHIRLAPIEARQRRAANTAEKESKRAVTVGPRRVSPRVHSVVQPLAGRQTLVYQELQALHGRFGQPVAARVVRGREFMSNMLSRAESDKLRAELWSSVGANDGRPAKIVEPCREDTDDAG